MIENTSETKKVPMKADAFTPVTLQGALVPPTPLLETHHDDRVNATKDVNYGSYDIIFRHSPESMRENIHKRLSIQKLGTMLPSSEI